MSHSRANTRWALVFLLCLSQFAVADVRTRPLDWAQPVIGVDLENFYQVSEDVYRSQQPDDEAITQLKMAGFRSILNLREYHADAEVAGEAITLYRLPMNAGEITDAEVEQAMTIIAKAPKPLLVHCWHGSDRTGAVVAMYRMVFQDWPREKAIDEFINGGYGYHKSFYPNIEQYLQNADIPRFKKVVARAKGDSSAQAKAPRQNVPSRQ